MDTFRKWLNKPKADDKSLLARFYHADHALTAVASELDSFDGRAEPERCSRLVSKLRTGQEHMLAITNQIMDELLGDERASRVFRAKFPEEVLQESLAGQLWFGAECLAAGSSILNREFESAAMRPLAKAVTKSLDNVRNLLREQCLRNNIPNSPRLNLNVNDAATEQLCESLKIFDRLFADFELRYVSAMVTVKTKQEHETQELICVLFSETVRRALELDLLDQDQVDSFDPALMFSIPRLAIVTGLIVFEDGPLNMDMADTQLSEMFRPFRTLLMKIRDLLRTLNKDQLRQLERLLCTNEDVTSSTYSASREPPPRSTNEANTEGGNAWPTVVVPKQPAVLVTSDNNKDKRRTESSSSGSSSSSSSDEEEDEVNVAMRDHFKSLDNEVAGLRQMVDKLQKLVGDGEEEEEQQQRDEDDAVEVSPLDRVRRRLDDLHDFVATHLPDDDDVPSATPPSDANTPPPPTAFNVINDCVSGYLIPNTNLGYLLQPNRPEGAPLTDSFIATDDEAVDEDLRRGDGEEEPENRCLVDHFIDNISTKSETSSTASTTGSTATTTSSTTNRSTASTSSSTEETTSETPPRSSPSPSSSTVSLSSVEDHVGGLPTTAEQRLVNSNTTKCLKTTNNNNNSNTEEPAAGDLKPADQDSGMCTETNSSDDRSPESEAARTVVGNEGAAAAAGKGPATTKETTRLWTKEEEAVRASEERSSQAHQRLSRRYANNWENLQEGGGPREKEMPSCSRETRPSGSRRREGSERGGGSSSGQPRRRHHHHHSSSGSYLRRCVAYPSTEGSGRRISREDHHDDLGLGTSSAIGDQVAPEIAEAIRDASKNHENLLHRLFVCIAGVADQLQTNFASDLRSILRSVFLMNVSPPEPDPNMRIQLTQSKAPADHRNDEAATTPPRDDLMFEFRPNENDVNEDGSGVGSNQSINSAEEVNPEMGGDSVFDETTTTVAGTPPSPSTPIKANNKQQRCSSEEQQSTRPQRPHTDPGVLSAAERQRNFTNSNGGGGGTVTRSHSLGDTTIAQAVVNQSHLIRTQRMRTTSSSVDTRPQGNQAATMAGQRTSGGRGQGNNRETLQRPPRWVPDEEAPRCMGCATLFTAFRRRHHCRHCGRVFCGICSNVSAPIPKYGFVKAVRVCRGCYGNERELGTATFS